MSAPDEKHPDAKARQRMLEEMQRRALKRTAKQRTTGDNQAEAGKEEAKASRRPAK